jgi:hypothetical protein
MESIIKASQILNETEQEYGGYGRQHDAHLV